MLTVGVVALRRRALVQIVRIACIISLVFVLGCGFRIGSMQAEPGLRTGYAGIMANGNTDHRVYEFRNMDGQFEERLSVAGGRRLWASASIGEGELDIEVTGPDGRGVIKWLLTADHPEIEATIDGEFAEGVYTMVMSAEGAHDGRIELRFSPQLPEAELVVALNGA
jgi:hypothetical protein